MIKREIKQWTNVDITYFANKVTAKHKELNYNQSKSCEITISDRTRITQQRSLALTLMSFSVVSVTKSLIELIYNSMSTIHQLPSPYHVLDHMSSLTRR